MAREVKRATKGKIHLPFRCFVTTSMYYSMVLCCLEFVVDIFSIFISSVKTVVSMASTLDFSVIHHLYISTLLFMLTSERPAEISRVTSFADLSNIRGNCIIRIGGFRRTECVYLTICSWPGASNRSWVCSLHCHHFSILAFYSILLLDTLLSDIMETEIQLNR